MTQAEQYLDYLGMERGEDESDAALADRVAAELKRRDMVIEAHEVLADGRWDDPEVMAEHDAYRDGKVHVLSEMCATCVFRPGNLMRLKAGRLRGMIDEATRAQSTIVCHSTLYRDDVRHAACRGFFDRYPTQPLQVAERLGMIAFDDPPPKS